MSKMRRPVLSTNHVAIAVAITLIVEKMITDCMMVCRDECDKKIYLKKHQLAVDASDCT